MTRTSRSFERSEKLLHVLSENPKISNPNANVDIASGALLHHVGLKDPSYYTTFFGWARVAGIGAQIYDERVVVRMGKAFQSTDPSTLLVTKCYDTLSDYELRSIST